MKKITKVLALSTVFCANALFAEKAPVYISPNNDGIKDTLEVPLQVKEKRYVMEWAFIITDEEGNVVRTIGNKEKRPDKFTFITFFKSLFKPKTGVTIPSTLTWNGICDDGSVAQDGLYYYQFTASDDNGNTAQSSKLKVIVDNTAPVVEIAELSDSQKNFGEGDKSVLVIDQKGSSETLWTASITDGAGKSVHSYRWEKSEPLLLMWDGTDDSGTPVPDGVYSYSITSTDEAGNVAEKAGVNNIIFSAEKPVVSIAINGSKYFSPETKSPLSTIAFDVSIPSPKSAVSALVKWAVEITDKNGKNVYKSYSGESDSPSSIIFDGKDSNGTLLPDGEYVARVTARYLNGYEPAPLTSPVFVLDTKAPEASVSVSEKVFNASDALVISQKQTSVEPAYTGAKNWTAKIVDQNGRAVRQYSFGSALPQSISWNGTDDSGTLAPDGEYHYELVVSELAGNIKTVNSEKFALDTSKTELLLSASPDEFSPNGDGIQDILTFKPVAKASSGIEAYTLEILDSNGKTVRSFKGQNSLPASISWDGKNDKGSVVADGTYSARLETVANSGDSAETKSANFTVDTQAPEIAALTNYNVFSPDGISSKQEIPVSVTKSSSENKWTASVVNSSGKTIKTFAWENGSIPNFAWNGTDDNGNKVANGTYSIVLSAQDAAGNKTSQTLQNITVDDRETKAYITTALTGISPNGDGVKESQVFSIKTALNEGISAWSFDVVDSNEKTVKSWNSADGNLLVPETLEWNGKLSDGNVAEGTFFGKLHIDYEKGNVVDANSSTFICSATPPQFDIITSPTYFSPDNDGNDDELFITLNRKNQLVQIQNWSFTIKDRNNNDFWKTSGKSSISEQIIWDGRGSNGETVQSAEDYPYEFTVTDELGMSNTYTGKISIDVLVVRDGNKLKMQVPSIIFRSDNADFGLTGEKDKNGKTIARGITPEQKANNERVLRRIAEILKKFGDYKVVIVGHANRLTDNPLEETEDNPSNWGPALIPLSKARAEYVRTVLRSYGISGDRLSVDGKGGTEPIANPKDRSANWKNRRVEFILEK